MPIKVTFKHPQPENSQPESSGSSVSGSTRPSRAKAINSVKELVQKLQENSRGKRKQTTVDDKSEESNELERSPKRHKSADEVHTTGVVFQVDHKPVVDEAASVKNATTTPAENNKANSVSASSEQHEPPTPTRARKSLPVTLKYRKSSIDKSTAASLRLQGGEVSTDTTASTASTTARQRLRLKPPTRPEPSAKLATSSRVKRHRPTRDNNKPPPTRSLRRSKSTTTTTPTKTNTTTAKSKSATAASKQPSRSLDTVLCVVCKGARWYDGNNIVFCDGCNDTYHRFCHDPPISSDVIDVLEANWFCKSCEEKRERGEAVVTSDVPAWSGMTGEKISLEDKRFYLHLLPYKKLVELLLYCESLHPDLPIYHTKAERIINSFRTTAVLHDEDNITTTSTTTTTTSTNPTDNNNNSGSNNNNNTMNNGSNGVNVNGGKSGRVTETTENNQDDDENVIPANFRVDGSNGSSSGIMKSNSNGMMKSNGGSSSNGDTTTTTTTTPTTPTVKSVSHWWHPKYGKSDSMQPDIKMGRVPGVKYTS